MNPEQLVEIALEAARKGAAVHQQHAGDLAMEDWDEKGTADFVTHVDREAEETVIGFIRERCPGHEFMAEESATLGDPEAVRGQFEGADHLWVIDPLDGTTNYLHGYPAYAASVAVTSGGRVVAGAVVDGLTGTAWWAWESGGAWRDGERIAVSPIDRLDRSLIGTGFPFKALQHLPTYLAQLDAVLRRTSGVRRAGAAALDLCHVADGRFEGFWEMALAPWDIAAGTLIIREAGGRVTGPNGEEDVRAAGSIVAGNPAVHRALLGVLYQGNPNPNGV